MKKTINTIVAIFIAVAGIQAAGITFAWWDSNPEEEIEEYIIYSDTLPINETNISALVLKFNTSTNFTREGTNVVFNLQDPPTGRRFYAVEAVSNDGIGSGISTNITAFVPEKVTGLTATPIKE